MDKKSNELRDFYLLWSTQSLSQLGSAMTGFALTLWLYEKTGSALSTAALTICTYAPYVLMSIFAGAITDRFDKKKTMLACDTFAAVCTVLVLMLYRTDLLRVWHLYAVNAVSGLMNTVQQPASEVAYTLVIPKEQYQRTSGLQSLSRSVISVGNPLIAAMAIVCFHPTFIIFGGSYNNDMLLMPFVMGAILWGLRWYREPVMRNIIPLALCIGLGMMTKLSGWMAAPAVAFVFIVVLIRHIKKPLRYIGQYAVFGVICLPLGIWWQVRNLITSQVPLSYIPNFGEQSFMYSGNLPLTQRLFSFGNGQLDFVYGSITIVDAPYNEYNPTLGLFKTAMFDECANSINDVHFPPIHITGPILFWISVVLFLTAFVCFVVSMVRKSGNMDGAERVYFSLLFGVELVSYYLFALAYPHSCTFNIRYCMPLIPLCAMGLALVLQRSESSQSALSTWFRRVMYAVSGAFCCMSYIVYTQVGMSM